jgi:hypothetical protein
MGRSFVAELLLPERRADGRTALQALQEERWALRKAGVSYSDWRLMAGWQRQDVLLRHIRESKALAERAQKQGIGGLVSALAAKILGL